MSTTSVLEGFDPDTFPDLRFDSGDTIIKLGSSPKNWLLVHRSTIQALMPTLAPALKEEWVRPEEFTHPVNRNNIHLYTLALKYVDQTFVLEGKEVEIPTSSNHHRSFDISPLSPGGWPAPEIDNRSDYLDTVLNGSIAAHKTIFAILYEYPISLKAICPYQAGDELARWPSHMHFTVDRISTICAYAEYYGCFSNVAPVLTDLMFAHRPTWTSVASKPEKYFVLSQKLRCRELYFDTLRHLIADARNSNFKKLAQLLGISVEGATAQFQPQIEKLYRIENGLLVRLHRLQLSTSYGVYSRSRYTVYTTFLDMLKWSNSKRSDGQKANEKSQLLARSIYGQWFLQQLYGEKVALSSSGKRRSESVGSFAEAIYKLDDAAGDFDPSALFGFNVASKYASIFRLGRKYNPQKQIQEELKVSVNEAKRLIDTALPVCQKQAFERVLTYRRTHAVGRCGPLAYFGLDEDDVPWKNEYDWEGPSQMPFVIIEAASEALLRALGMFMPKSEADLNAERRVLANRESNRRLGWIL